MSKIVEPIEVPRALYDRILSKLRMLLAEFSETIGDKIADGGILGDLEDDLDFLRDTLEVLGFGELQGSTIRKKAPKLVRQVPRSPRAQSWPCRYKGCSFVGKAAATRGRHEKAHLDAGDAPIEKA